MQYLPVTSPVPGGWLAAEKRKFQRVRLDVRLRATVHKRDSHFPITELNRKPGPRVPIQGRLCNLSLGGLAALLPVELAVGERVELDLTLPSVAQPLKLKAVIRNRRGSTYGMEFTDTTRSQRAVIAFACGELESLD